MRFLNKPLLARFLATLLTASALPIQAQTAPTSTEALRASVLALKPDPERARLSGQHAAVIIKQVLDILPGTSACT